MNKRVQVKKTGRWVGKKFCLLRWSVQVEEKDNLTCFNSCQTKNPPLKSHLLKTKVWSKGKVFETTGFNTRHLIHYKLTKLIVQFMPAMHRRQPQAPKKNCERKLKTDKLTRFTTCTMKKHQTPREKLKGKLTITCWSEGINSRAFWITRQPYICSASDRTWPRIRSAKASFCSRLPNQT